MIALIEIQPKLCSQVSYDEIVEFMAIIMASADLKLSSDQHFVLIKKPNQDAAAA